MRPSSCSARPVTASPSTAARSSRASMIPTSPACSPRPGDLALRRGRHHRLRPDRSRLGRRKRQRGRRDRDLRAGIFPRQQQPDPLGAGGPRRIARAAARGPRRQDRRHELVKTTQRYFESRNIPVTVEFSWGTTEIKARLLDAIVDCTETGSSLRANNLRIVETLLKSTTRFIASKTAWSDPVKREKMENIAMLLTGAMAARSKVGLKMNVPEPSSRRSSAFCPRRKARRSAAWPIRRGWRSRSSLRKSRSAS